jgi:hypothetical protein
VPWSPAFLVGDLPVAATLPLGLLSQEGLRRSQWRDNGLKCLPHPNQMLTLYHSLQWHTGICSLACHYYNKITESAILKRGKAHLGSWFHGFQSVKGSLLGQECVADFVVARRKRERKRGQGSTVPFKGMPPKT